MKILICFMLLFMLVSCKSKSNTKVEFQIVVQNQLLKYKENYSVIEQECFIKQEGWMIGLNPKDFTPLSFLGVMLAYKRPSLTSETVIDNFPPNWVKFSDVDTLINLIESKEVCSCMKNPLSSHIDFAKSDIGGYALMFIKSFRNQEQIKFGLNQCPNSDEKMVQEVKEWWTSYKLGRKE